MKHNSQNVLDQFSIINSSQKRVVHYRTAGQWSLRRRFLSLASEFSFLLGKRTRCNIHSTHTIPVFYFFFFFIWIEIARRFSYLSSWRPSHNLDGNNKLLENFFILYVKKKCYIYRIYTMSENLRIKIL